VLEAAGVRLDLTPEQVATCIEEAGVGFMFAPHHHGAMRFALGPRREMGTRTLFNLLGPLSNPASAPNQLIGVFAKSWVEPLVRVLRNLGSRHVLVVHSEDGLDEISLSAPTFVGELKDGEVTTYVIEPEMFGLERAPLEAVCVGTVAESLATMGTVLAGTPGPARDIVGLNAGAAIYAADCAPSLTEGVRMARSMIDRGAAAERLERLVALCATF